MVGYTKINVKLSNLQLHKLKKWVKNNEKVTLRLGKKNFNKEDLPHKLLLMTRQNTKLRDAVNNNMATDIKLSRMQIKKIIQSGGFLGSLLGKLEGPLMKVAMPLAKNVLAPLGLTAAMFAIDRSIQKKMHGSGATTLVTANEDMDDMKIIKTLENSGILLKVVTKTIKNETKEQKGGFLSMLLGTLGASLLGNLLSGGKGIVRVGEGIVRAGEGVKKIKKSLQQSLVQSTLMPLHPRTNFEIREYYEDEPRFNGVFSRNNLPKTIKNGA